MSEFPEELLLGVAPSAIASSRRNFCQGPRVGFNKRKSGMSLLSPVVIPCLGVISGGAFPIRFDLFREKQVSSTVHQRFISNLGRIVL